MPRSRSSRYSTSRQKSCQPCFTARAKCDRKETCGRCALRGLICTYTIARSGDTSTLSEDATEPLIPIDIEEPQTPKFTERQIHEELQSMTVSGSASAPGPDPNTAIDLVCPINGDDIKNRWLNSYVPLPGQTVKSYPPNVIKFVYRILKSYASMAIRGRAPPFVHHTQHSSPLLSTCFTLLRLCKEPSTGSVSVVAEILQREMTRLHEEHNTHSGMELLAVFQAYLIYTMALFFHLTPASMPFLRQAIINLQEIACATSRQGLVCVAEQRGTRPLWETWILAEAKRRTLYTMYFLDNVLSAEDGLPTYIGHELKGLYAPSSKDLWRGDRDEWEREYVTFEVQWVMGIFQLDELWPIPTDTTAYLDGSRRKRTDRWLEDVDEFGAVLYAVTAAHTGGECEGFVQLPKNYAIYTIKREK